MHRNGSLLFKAGPAAFEDVRKHGFSVDRIGTIAGASGGAKWLVLSQVDRIIADRILPKLDGPVHLIGSSIGSWRHSCYAQSDPLAAIDRFESAYLDQTYSPNPDMRRFQIMRVKFCITCSAHTARRKSSHIRFYAATS